MGKRTPRVALIVEMSNGYARELLHGIRTYIRKFGPWSIYYGERSRGDAPPDWMRRWKGEGILARIENRVLAEAIGAKKVPTVDLSAARLLPNLPCVETDNEGIARLAADHLLERGFKNFGFCGLYGFNWSRWRRDHFSRILAEAGFPCHVYDPKPSKTGAADSFWQDATSLARWVRALPKPVGVMAAWDGTGLQVLDSCRRLGIAVPDDVAVVGVDDDELLCDLAEPRLTSIASDPRRTGYEAAALLDRMMAGEDVPPSLRVIEPLGISTRQSTDVLAIEDREISQAVRFIREHACEGIRVDDVLAAIPLSRRMLEIRFKKHLRRTPHEEIVRVQLRRVQELLLGTDLTMPAIASRSGFKHVEYMSVVFRDKIGEPPGEFRARHQSSTKEIGFKPSATGSSLRKPS